MDAFRISYLKIPKQEFTLCFDSESSYWHFSYDQNDGILYLTQEKYWDVLYNCNEFIETDISVFLKDEWVQINNIINFIYYRIKSCEGQYDIDEEELFCHMNEFMLKNNL